LEAEQEAKCSSLVPLFSMPGGHSWETEQPQVVLCKGVTKMALRFPCWEVFNGVDFVVF